MDEIFHTPNYMNIQKAYQRRDDQSIILIIDDNYIQFYPYKVIRTRNNLLSAFDEIEINKAIVEIFEWWGEWPSLDGVL